MPDSSRCVEMLNHANVVVQTMEKMVEMVREHEQSLMAVERMRDFGPRQGGYDDEMYGEDMKHQGYGENKKRRGVC